MRIYTGFILGLAFIVAGCTTNPSNNKDFITDNNADYSDQYLTDMMVGAWSTSPEDTDSTPGYSIYMKDGTLVFVGYEDAKCTIPAIVAHGVWEVRSGQLRITVTRSSNTDWTAPGDQYIDKIVSIGEQKAELLSDKGRTFFRTKGIECYYGNDE